MTEFEFAQRALTAWDSRGERLVPTESGLINQTFSIYTDSGAPAGVLQRLNTRIFSPAVHEDIEAVTAHLAARGRPTPRLVPNRDGALWLDDPEIGVWRRFTWIGDRTIDKVRDPSDARSAGRCVGAFHGATADLRWDFRSVRGGFHDTTVRMSQLREALELHRHHRLYDRVAPLAEAILGDFDALPHAVDLPVRVVHGDLKISNVRFLGAEAVALVDLDTLAYGTLDAELGDALRSWCNPSSEDHDEPIFSLEILEAALQGYAESGNATPEEWASILPGTQRISLELAARFAADALHENYFGFNPQFGTRGDHNLLRATGQHRLSRSLAMHRATAELLIQRLASQAGHHSVDHA